MTKTEKGSRKAAFSFLEANTGAPLPGLAASAANRIPRWLLILVVLLYIGHGLFYRDPWRGDDMLGLALARTTAEGLLRGDFSLLLLPQLGDLAWNQQGPLWTALLAIFMLPAYFWAALTASPVPIHLLDDLARIPVALAMAFGLVAVWKATDRFARRREAQPVDPLGLGPRASAFGKTLGDCALLLTIAALGLVYPLHQLGTAAIELLLQALLLWALATAPETPKRAGLQAGSIVVASLLTQGVGLAITQIISLACVFIWVQPLRRISKEFLARAVLTTIMLTAIWLAAASILLPGDRILGWWRLGLIGLSPATDGAASAAIFQSVGPWLRESLWRWWPIWPIAIFGLLSIRQTRLSRSPHWSVPIALAAVAIVLGLLGPDHWKVQHIVPIVPLAMIAAFSLLSLPRPIVNLVDWFAVTLFTAAGIFVWLYWTALNFGVPAALAAKVPLRVPGIIGTANLYEILIGVVATIAWIALVLWRIRRGAPRLWRPVALSSGGVLLLWSLLATLWLPAIDRLQGQRLLAGSLERGWLQSASARLGITPDLLEKQITMDRNSLPVAACVGPSQQSTAFDAMAIAASRLPISSRPACLWRLGIVGEFEREVTNATVGQQWRVVWQSNAEDRRGRQRYLLLERLQ
jgi:hypothetical protein